MLTLAEPFHLGPRSPTCDYPASCMPNTVSIDVGEFNHTNGASLIPGNLGVTAPGRANRRAVRIAA